MNKNLLVDFFERALESIPLLPVEFINGGLDLLLVLHYGAQHLLEGSLSFLETGHIIKILVKQEDKTTRNSLIKHVCRLGIDFLLLRSNGLLQFRSFLLEIRDIHRSEMIFGSLFSKLTVAVQLVNDLLLYSMANSPLVLNNEWVRFFQLLLFIFGVFCGLFARFDGLLKSSDGLISLFDSSLLFLDLLL